MVLDEFRNLIMLEIEAVFRLAFHASQSEDEAAELVRLTYIKAFQGGPAAAGTQRIRHWLFKIMYAIAKERLGQPSNSAPKPPMRSRETVTDPEVLRFIDAMASMTFHCRTVIVLWSVEGLRYAEIADVVGDSVGTVTTRLRRAQNRLTERMKGTVRDSNPGNEGPKQSC